ncbi:hypothetical protein [Pedobacter frigiditerrae]|uniref:hypothetical protein n=1 Tax=Pedobacter frigiditerrae TaxID=2530452 RepID=UPI00293026EC|nr:hypothetical protein [Pedobacter frigiditerrae]
MEIEIYKHNGKEKSDSKYYPILSYKTIAHNPSLLLVSDEKMSFEDNSQTGFFEIKKIQFIASCKTDFSDSPLLIAFYLGEGCELYAHNLTDLPGHHYQGGERFLLIDYKSYSEICEYTGETKLSFSEYFQEIKSGNLGPNSLLENNEKLLNKDEQDKLYKEKSTF